MAPDWKRGGGPCSRPLARRMLFAIMIVVLGAVVSGSPLPQVPDGDSDDDGYYMPPDYDGSPWVAANRLTRRFESAHTGDGAYFNLARRGETYAGGRDAMKVHYKRSLRDALDAGSPDLRRNHGIQPPETNPFSDPSPGSPGRPPLLRRDTKHGDVSARHRNEEIEQGGGEIYRRSGPPGGDVEEYMDFGDQRHRAHEKGAPRSGSLTRRDVSAMDGFEEDAFLVRRNQNDDHDGPQPSPHELSPGNAPGIGGVKSAHNHVHRRQEGPILDPGSSGSGGGDPDDEDPPDDDGPHHRKRSNLYRRDRGHGLERDHGFRSPSEHDDIGDADAPVPLFRRDLTVGGETERHGLHPQYKATPNDGTPPVPVVRRSEVYNHPLVRREVVDDTIPDDPELYSRDVRNEGEKREELSSGPGSGIKSPAERETGGMAKDWQWNLAVQF